MTVQKNNSNQVSVVNIIKIALALSSLMIVAVFYFVRSEPLADAVIPLTFLSIAVIVQILYSTIIGFVNKQLKLEEFNYKDFNKVIASVLVSCAILEFSTILSAVCLLLSDKYDVFVFTICAVSIFRILNLRTS